MQKINIQNTQYISSKAFKITGNYYFAEIQNTQTMSFEVE